MPLLKSRLLITAAAALALSGCDRVELFRVYVANLNTQAVVKAPLPIELPFEDHDGQIVVEASVNGSKPVGFLLDTSAPVVSLLDSESTRHLHLDMSGAQRLGSAENPTAPFSARQDGLDIDFGGLSLKNQTALALSASGLSCGSDTAAAFPFGGVIGHDILRRFVVEVDRDRGIVRLHDPEAYRHRGIGRIVSISFEERQPFIEAIITPQGAPSYSAKLKLDTGADVDVALVPGSSAEIVTPAIGVVSSSCTVAGEATYRSGPLIRIQLGDQIVASAINYATGREVVAAGQSGRLGARFLARFNIVFDYAHERMILEPRATSTLANGSAGANGRVLATTSPRHASY